MTSRYCVFIFASLLLVNGCCGNRSRKVSKNDTDDHSTIRVECLYVTRQRSSIMYVIETDSLYCNNKAWALDKSDILILNSNINIIDSLSVLFNGTCIENDAPGVLYGITTNTNTCQWVNCFPQEDTMSGECKDIMNLFDKYFFFAYKQIYEEDYKTYELQPSIQSTGDHGGN
jgi:hypothetical protein